jgi:serine protease Do
VVSDLTAAQRKEMKIENGVMVDAAEGPAARVGMRAGDVILLLNNTDVKDARQFNAMVAKLDTKKASSVLVRRGDSAQFLTIRPN